MEQLDEIVTRLSKDGERLRADLDAEIADRRAVAEQQKTYVDGRYVDSLRAVAALRDSLITSRVRRFFTGR